MQVDIPFISYTLEFILVENVLSLNFKVVVSLFVIKEAFNAELTLSIGTYNTLFIIFIGHSILFIVNLKDKLSLKSTLGISP